jgi:hypothetical protein
LFGQRRDRDPKRVVAVIPNAQHGLQR